MMNVCADSWGLAPSCQNNLLCLSEDRHGRAVSRLTITMSPCQHSSNLKETRIQRFSSWTWWGFVCCFTLGHCHTLKLIHASNMSNPMWKEPSCAPPVHWSKSAKKRQPCRGPCTVKPARLPVQWWNVTFKNQTMEGIISNLHFIVYNSGSLKKHKKSPGGELICHVEASWVLDQQYSRQRAQCTFSKGILHTSLPCSYWGEMEKLPLQNRAFYRDIT